MFFSQGKSLSKLFLLFLYLSKLAFEMLFFNLIKNLILSKVLSRFSPELNNARFAVLSYFLIYPSISSKK